MTGEGLEGGEKQICPSRRESFGKNGTENRKWADGDSPGRGMGGKDEEKDKALADRKEEDSWNNRRRLREDKGAKKKRGVGANVVVNHSKSKTERGKGGKKERCLVETGGEDIPGRGGRGTANCPVKEETREKGKNQRGAYRANREAVSINSRWNNW